MESSCPELFSWPWNEVLERLLHLVADPVVKSLNQSKASPLPGLTRHCCHLLGRVVAELVHQCSATEVNIMIFISGRLGPNLFLFFISSGRATVRLRKDFTYNSLQIHKN